MPTHTPTTARVALLRGINVGGNGMVSMAELKKTFEKLGFTDVRTYINSGNIIFRPSAAHPADARRIEQALAKDFGLEIKVVLRSEKELARVVKAIPNNWVNDKTMKCDVMFLFDEVDKRSILKQMPFNPEIEDSMYIPGAVIWRIDREKIGKSRILKLVGTKLYKQMTVRNPNTVRKLYQLMKAKKDE
jgi:uncharacterized protein (DUF1697 family)